MLCYKNPSLALIYNARNLNIVRRNKGKSANKAERTCRVVGVEGLYIGGGGCFEGGRVLVHLTDGLGTKTDTASGIERRECTSTLDVMP